MIVENEYRLDDLPKDLQNKLFELWDALFFDRAKINEDYFSENPRNNQSVVYHYTNAQNFQKIIESRKIRFSDLFYTNDPSEIMHSLDIAKAVFKSSFIDKSEYHTELGKFFFEKINRCHLSNTGKFLTFCSSVEFDDLGQWRAYAADGAGFALGFDWSLLERAISLRVVKLSRSFHSALMKYNDTLLNELFLRIWKITDQYVNFNGLANYSLLSQANYLRFLSGIVAMFIASIGLFSKHHGYNSEKEYRLAVYQRKKSNKNQSLVDEDRELRELLEDDSDIKYYERDGQLIPYLDIDFPIEALKEVRIGPACNNDVETIRGFLKSLDYLGDIKVEKSDIPYRSRKN